MVALRGRRRTVHDDELDLRDDVNREVRFRYRADNPSLPLDNFLSVYVDDVGAAYPTLRTMQSWVARRTSTGCWDANHSNVTVTQCHFNGQEIDRAPTTVRSPMGGRRGKVCTLPTGSCSALVSSATVGQTPERIICKQ